VKEQSVEQARQHLGELVRAASRGEATLITYGGIPAAAIVPLSGVHAIMVNQQLLDEFAAGYTGDESAGEGGPHA
jgi:prevent-host-death family protein